MSIHIKLDQDRTGREYDKALRDLKSGTDHSKRVEFISNAAGTVSGNPIVMIRFWASTPKGTAAFPVACMLTLKELLGAAQALQGCHGTPEGVLGIIGTAEADQHGNHTYQCPARQGGTCNCGEPGPRVAQPGQVMAVQVPPATDRFGQILIEIRDAIMEAGANIPDGRTFNLTVVMGSFLYGWYNEHRHPVPPGTKEIDVEHDSTMAPLAWKLRTSHEPDPPKGFDYGPKKPDGQHSDHPALPEESRKAYVRPVRLSYKHLKCGGVTRMPQKCAETYAADPTFYGKTFCCQCGDYFPVGPDGEFIWEDGKGDKVGT